MRSTGGSKTNNLQQSDGNAYNSGGGRMEWTDLAHVEGLVPPDLEVEERWQDVANHEPHLRKASSSTRGGGGGGGKIGRMPRLAATPASCFCVYEVSWSP